MPPFTRELPNFTGPIAMLAQQRSIPLTTQLNPQMETAFQDYRCAHPDMLVEPTRDASGQLIPQSLYDLRGAFAAGYKPSVNPVDQQPHWTDAYKLPAFQEPEGPNIGISQFSNNSNLSKIFPMYAGEWYTQDGDSQQFQHNPAQRLNPDAFYPKNFGVPSHIPHQSIVNPVPLQGLLLAQ